MMNTFSGKNHCYESYIGEESILAYLSEIMPVRSDPVSKPPKKTICPFDFMSARSQTIFNYEITGYHIVIGF